VDFPENVATTALPPVPEGSAKKARWFASPISSLLSLVLGVLGLAWGFISYNLAEKKPDLVFAQQPVQTMVVRAGELSKLGVTYGGRVVTSDITAAQIAIWNAGRKPILANDILEPLVIRMHAGATILDSKIRFITRDVVGIQCENSAARPNEVDLRFRILEPDDGAIVQVIYEGHPGIDASMSGVLVGQNSIRKAQISGVDELKYSPSSGRRRAVTFSIGYVLGYGFLALMALGSLVGAIEMFRNVRRARIQRLTGLIGALFLVGLGTALVALIVHFARVDLDYSLGPPFYF